MTKYVFKAYREIFPELFQKEKARLAACINLPLIIEHIGSTAIPGLGGKGIIDIAIAVDRKSFESVSKQLQTLGYEFRPQFSTPDRYYFIAILPDLEEESRRYHIHLTYPENDEWKNFIGFRDYLIDHPEELQEYAEVKRKAALDANQDGEKYRKLKEPIFKKINSLHNRPIIPVILGSGIPLFNFMKNEQVCRFISTQSYPSGLVQLQYEVIK